MNYLIFRPTFTCIVAVISLGRYEAAILTFPINTMALSNTSVQFPCSTNSNKSLQWYFTQSGTTASIPLYTRGNLTSAGESRYIIDASIQGHSNLIIGSVDFSHAGRYKCSEGSFGAEVEADIAVIEPQPLCQINASATDNSVVENSHLWMKCSVLFVGRLNFVMSWFRESTGNVLPNAGNQSVIVIQVNCSDNGETFTFKSSFSQDNNSNLTIISWNYTVKALCRPTTTEPLGSAVALISSAVALSIVIVIVVLLCLQVINAKGWTIKQTVLIAEPEPDILRSDLANRDNDYYVADDGVAPQTGPAFSIYELIEGDDNETVETPTDSLRTSQQVLVPGYTRVNKNDRRQERRSREMQMTPQQQTQVYSEIAQTDLTPVTDQSCNMSDLQSSTRIANQKNYFGADGTEYTQMNNLSLEDRPAEMIPKDPMFRPVDNYAQIDHTKRAPPPLPKL